MEMTSSSFRINKYLPIVILYFFLNCFLLPIGLLYTTLLTPFFIIWLLKYPSIRYIWIFFLVSVPFMIIHLEQGVDVAVYFKSYLLLLSVYIFCVAFYQFLHLCTSLRALFKDVVIVNILLVFIAAICFFITPLRDIMWYNNAFTSGIKDVYRLKLFTYEPSYYSLLLMPIVLFYYLKIFLFRMPNKWFVFLSITIPLLLSLSFGALIGMALALILLFCANLRLMTVNPKLPVYILVTVVALLVTLFIIFQLFPNNIIFSRIENVFKGHDTSFSGRTFDSLYLGWKLAAQKSLLFGSGAGQIRVLGQDLFNTFYVNHFTTDQLVIPNSIGDILAQYGLLGVVIKLSLEIYFFVKTKVHANIYRTSLFLFVFIYQFTGSFISNIAEYVIWLLAFSPIIFPEFNKQNIYAKRYRSSPGQYDQLKLAGQQ